jgi:uncharacterized protein (DUF2147 family)
MAVFKTSPGGNKFAGKSSIEMDTISKKEWTLAMSSDLKTFSGRGLKFVTDGLQNVAPLILVLLVSTFAPVPTKADRDIVPVGLWKTENAQIEIFEVDGKLNGKIAALDKQYTTDGIEKTDISNPDPAKRSRPLIGLIFMTGFTPQAPGHWEHGTIYDPKTGNTYASTLEYDGGDMLKVRGYIGISLIGRSVVWTKVKQ